MSKGKNRTKRQHFVPRCYLTRFSTNGKNLWAYDKLQNKVFNPSFWDIAQEKFFYDYPIEALDAEDLSRPFDLQHVEKGLSKIESGFNLLLNKLLPRVEAQGITSGEIIRLAHYVAIQWMRTREYREVLFAIQQQSMQKIADWITKRNLPELPKEQYPKVVLNKEKFAAEHNNHFFKKETIYGVANCLNNHIWVVGINNTEHSLYTSDNPVVRRANTRHDNVPLIGLLDPGIEFAFPLSSRHLLLILEKRYFRDMKKYHGKCILLEPEQVADYNKLQVVRSFRQVYCEQPDFTLAERLYKERPDIYQSERSRVEVEISDVELMKSHLIVQVLE